MRAASTRPQAPWGRTPSRPQPGLAPRQTRAVRSNGVDQASRPSSQVPAKPPTSTAAGGPVTPPGARSSPTVAAPTTSSTRPGWSTAPTWVTSRDPGNEGGPRDAHPPAPIRATTARWATVSALTTTVGDASPDTYRSGPRDTRHSTPSSRHDRRSATARVTPSTGPSAPRWRWTVTEETPRAVATSAAPSSTRWGRRAHSRRSFPLAGSLSLALTTSTGRPPPARAVATLRANGNPPPPRPSRPLDRSRARTWPPSSSGSVPHRPTCPARVSRPPSGRGPESRTVPGSPSPPTDTVPTVPPGSGPLPGGRWNGASRPGDTITRPCRRRCGRPDRRTSG